MIVTAAQAIMRHTLTMKKKWRNLSRKEHSGNLQWEIYNKKKKDRFMKHNFNALFYKQFQNEKKYRQKVKCSNVYIWLRKKIWNLFCLLCRRNINGSSIWYINVRLAEIFLRGKEETYHKLLVAQILILAQLTTRGTTTTTRRYFQPFLQKIIK